MASTKQRLTPCCVDVRQPDTLATWVNTGYRIGTIEWAEGQAVGGGFLWVSADGCSSCPQVAASSSVALDDDTGEWDLSMCD